MPMLDPDSIKSLRQVGEYSALGIQLVGSILVFGMIGWWLDRRFASAPWGVLIGTLFGSAGGIYAVIRAIIRANRDANG